MPKIEEPNTKAVRKALKKAKNIQLAVKIYKDPIFGLLLRAATSLYYYSKNSITNYLNDTPKHEYISDIYIKQQNLSPAEKKALINHIIDCYKLMLPLDVELLHYYANELCRAKGDNKLLEKH